MKFDKRILFFIFIFFTNFLFAQKIPIGTWQSFYPYSSATSVAVAGNKIYAGNYGLLEHNTQTNENTTYSKVNGLSDVKITQLAYEPLNDNLLIVYENSNLDILHNGVFYNLSDIKNFAANGTKTINKVSIINQDAYLSTSVGIIIVDLEKREIKNTYPLLINSVQTNVNDIQLYHDSLITLTNVGIFKANISNTNLQNTNNWRAVNNKVYTKMFFVNDSIYIYTKSKLDKWDGNTIFQTIYTPPVLDIQTVLYANNYLNIGLFRDTLYGKMTRITTNGTFVEDIGGTAPVQLEADAQGNIWIGDIWQGLVSFDAANNRTIFTIDAPFSTEGYTLKIFNNDVYICAGGLNDLKNQTANRGGISKYSNGNWTKYNQWNYGQMNSITDVLDVVVEPSTNNILAASYDGGLLSIAPDGTMTIDKTNIPLRTGTTQCEPSFMQYDNSNNLWIAVSNTQNNLVVKKADGTWQYFSLPLGSTAINSYDALLIDDFGQKWVSNYYFGLNVYNDNNTIDNSNDDKQRTFTKGAGNGNLASTNTNCLAKDADGKIWIGTDNGISIVNSPGDIFNANGVDAENKIVQYDNYAGHLFDGQSVRTIAVDGANRKWVGTQNGVWLISADASIIVQQFNENNSPLPSNEIQSIAINNQNGNVYISTSKGLVAYNAGATVGTAADTGLYVYPNPAKVGASTIAISGLSTNADVRITDVTGQLVYRTKALGGTAVWDGKTYTGKKPTTGVYYIFASNADGSITQNGKFILQE